MGHKCNEYIIKNNKFIRDFESMYKNISDPWNQENSNHGDLENLILLTKEYITNPKNILDIGCATGYFSIIVNKIFSGSDYIGTDISSSAINKASEKFTSKFLTDDIRINNQSFINQFDLIMCSKTIYYVAPEIDIVIENIISYLKKGGIFSCLYNYSESSFSSKWLNPEILSSKLTQNNLEKKKFITIESENDNNYYLIFKKK